MSCIINVGGAHFETTSATLGKSPVLARLCADAENIAFVDRDGGLFSYILSYLRTGKLWTPRDESLNQLIAVEAAYFELDELRDAVEQLAIEARSNDVQKAPKSHHVEDAVRELTVAIRYLHEHLRDRKRFAGRRSEKSL